jgi:hypothetical protein
VLRILNGFERRMRHYVIIKAKSKCRHIIIKPITASRRHFSESFALVDARPVENGPFGSTAGTTSCEQWKKMEFISPTRKITSLYNHATGKKQKWPSTIFFPDLQEAVQKLIRSKSRV